MTQLSSAGIVTPLPSDVALVDVQLPPATRAELGELLAEHAHTPELRRHGLEPRRRILLHGPPGCGKSMSARALAHELRLPSVLVRYDAIIGSWLGQTAQRIQELFRFAREVPAVIVIDEIDALTRTRGRPNDVGEMDRALIAFLQHLEHEPIAGLLVATTNVAAHLDPALWRRFDLTLELPRPSAKVLADFARNKARAAGLHLNGTLKTSAPTWSAYADVVRTLDGLARRRIIKGE